jgi:hypothetical protein
MADINIPIAITTNTETITNLFIFIVSFLNASGAYDPQLIVNQLG